MNGYDITTPAVALVCHHHVGLGIVRSLGSLGVETHAVEGDRYSPALASKYCRRKYIFDLHRAPIDESVAFMMRVGTEIGQRSVLIPTSDAAVTFVADHAKVLSKWYIFPDRKPSLIHQLCDKRGMYRLARQCGVATPESSFPSTRKEVEEFCRTAMFPVLLKPIVNEVPAFQPGMKKWRMMLVHTRDDLLHHYDAFDTASAPNVMLQEYIPGGDEMTWTFNGYFDRNGDCVTGFTGRKLRNFPAYFGQASLALCEDNEDVRDITIGFMKAIGYRGPLDIGYRYDVRDGRYKVNDVNPRIGAMFRLFVADNGIDVVRAMYRDLTDQPVGPAPNPHGRKWLVEDVDCLASFRYLRDRRLTLGEWYGSLRGVTERTLLRADDPKPLFAACMMDIKRALSDRFGEKAKREIVTEKIRPAAASIKLESHGQPASSDLRSSQSMSREPIREPVISE
jgi:D-aspartate ligase